MMSKSKRKFNQIRISFILLLIPINFTIFNLPVLAQYQRYSSGNIGEIQLEFNRDKQGSCDRGRPHKRKGIASRNH